MKKIAAIDIGTNSVRLLLSGWDGRSLLCPRKLLITTRIGEGTSNTDVLGREPMERTADAVLKLANDASGAGYDLIGVYATSAVREAPNRSEFERLCRDNLGFDIDVLSGRAESLSAFLGASSPDISSEMIADIGGGSTELSFGRNGLLEYAGSVRVGAVRMREMFAEKDGSLNAVKRKELHSYALDRIATLVKDASDGVALAGVGGTFTTFAAMKLGLDVYDPKKVQNTMLARDFIEETTVSLAEKSFDERLGLPGLTRARADIIPSAGIIALAVLDAVGKTDIRVSERDGLDGYVLMKIRGETPELA